MLKQRVITAVLILPIAVAAIVLTPLHWFDAALLLVLAALMREWMRLTGCSRFACLAYTLLAPAIFLVSVLDWSQAWLLREVLLAVATALWVLCPFWFFRRPALHRVLKSVAGLLVVAGAGVALHELKAIALNGSLVLLLFLLVWAADVGAYFAGKGFGRRKLAPSISPGKTWEGLAGGSLLTIAVGVGAGIYLADMQASLLWVAVLLAVSIVSVIGDLTESLLKRQANVKDSGTLLPGHGGVLDRLDSVLAAAPLFIFFIEHTGLLEQMARAGQ